MGLQVEWFARNLKKEAIAAKKLATTIIAITIKKH
jgi:hypothetical protein